MRSEYPPKFKVVKIGLDKSRLVNPRGRTPYHTSARKQEDDSASFSSSSTLDTLSTVGSEVPPLEPMWSDLFFFCSSENDLCCSYPSKESSDSIYKARNVDRKRGVDRVANKIPPRRHQYKHRYVNSIMEDSEDSVSYF